MKKLTIVLLGLLFANTVSAVAPTWTVDPCTKDADGKVINTSGSLSNPNLKICDFVAEEVKLKLYKLALCTQAPTYSATVPPDVSSCKFIVDNSTPTDIVVSQTSGFNLSDVQQPPSGTYPYAFVVFSNNVIVKTKVQFLTSKSTTWGSGSGEWCWTNGSTIDRYTGTSPRPTGNGVTCGPSVGSDYDFNTVVWGEPNNGNAWASGGEPVPNGYNYDAFLNDNLLGVFETDTTRWAITHQFNTPITISDNTQSLEMSLNLSTGVGVLFDQNTSNVIRQLEDGPFGFIIRPINQ